MNDTDRDLLLSGQVDHTDAYRFAAASAPDAGPVGCGVESAERREPGRERFNRHRQARKLFMEHGGQMHGPNVEHYYIPESKFYEFVDALHRAAIARARGGES